MVHVKKMNESAFAQILKEFHALGELIRARQDEKQAILDQFDSESKRFVFGKISEKALESSIRKTNKEINRLDREITKSMNRAKRLGERMAHLISAQKPLLFKATLSGISSKREAKKRRVKRKPVKKKKKRK
tara:strand:- start:713 stop:1108 length:396 start_codon:yes stop_codon:yes gene_type:complete